MHANDPVNRIMSEPVLTIDIDDPVEEMLRLFVSYPVHHLPVVKDQRVVGMLSAADLMKIEFFLPPPGPARRTLLKERFRVETLMRTPVVTVSEHESVQRAAELMAKNGFHSLPVVNADDRLIGILTTTDLMHGCLREAESSGEHAPSDAHSVWHGIETISANSRQRLRALESVAQEAKRYLNAGQDERLHAELRKAIERLDLLEQRLGKATDIGIDTGE